MVAVVPHSLVNLLHRLCGSSLPQLVQVEDVLKQDLKSPNNYWFLIENGAFFCRT